ncbi:nucleotidyltransferase domain-containing protein [Isoptericola croceus]|uniref:nucleotidyltransferase domain-containing protein n=1 Tax=Isoptericola croceus TaxID=3031406 RepID=UPI0023F80C48|nr:nucleotidyltransferase domain-containing protein [Isoptericola croceus]
MRAIPATLDPGVVAEIDRRLALVAVEHHVRVPWAVESGSRAWGFPSPDSDYDCRFLFVRRPERYLALWPDRDVVETPLDKVFDVNGWDLAKAVRLVVKGNATVIEWLQSPIVYTGDETFRYRLLAFAEQAADRVLLARHYLHVARNQQRRAPTLKRFLYTLRPAVSLRWLADNPGSGLPPMDLPTLLGESAVPAPVRAAAGGLIELKAVTRETGTATPPAVLTEFVADELGRAEVAVRAAGRTNRADVRALAEHCFRSEIERVWSAPRPPG